MSTAVYVGSFDPVTNGHIDIIERGLKVFDKLIIGVGVNSKKQSLFPLNKRFDLIAASLYYAQLLPKYDGRLHLECFEGLAIDFGRKHYANAIIRGIRNNPDFEAEFAFAHINTRMAPEIDHIYFMASEKDHFISSSTVKELSLYGTKYKDMVPYPVFEAMENKKKHENE